MAWFRHNYMIAGVQHLLRTTRHVALGEMSTPITQVLFVCQSCGKPKTEELDGHWTMDELAPKSGRVEADREFFKKLGVKL